MKIDKILFYYPSRITGGTEYLFKRCAEHLAETQSMYKIYYADYFDGFVRKNIESEKVKFVEVGEDKLICVEDGTAVILQLNIIYQISNYIIYDREKSICLFWCLHKLNIKNDIFVRNVYFISRRLRKQLGESLYNLTDMNVVKFMNFHGCYKVFRDLLHTPKQFQWLPNVAPIRFNSNIDRFERISDNILKFCWLGRLDLEKSRNLETYMNELEFLHKTIPLTLSIVGKGPCEDYLKSVVSRYSYPIEFVGEKRDEELDKFIREETEIGLASGTSAYEFALRGKPVIVEWEIDRVYNAGERATYVYNYEDELYDSPQNGELIWTKADDFIHKIDNIFKNYSTIAENEYKFVQVKNVNNCCKTLLESVQNIAKLDPKKVIGEIKTIDHIVNVGRRRIKIMYKLLYPFIKHYA